MQGIELTKFLNKQISKAMQDTLIQNAMKRCMRQFIFFGECDFTELNKTIDNYLQKSNLKDLNHDARD